MLSTYDHQKVETKWREAWRQEVTNGNSNWLFDQGKLAAVGKGTTNKLYLLDMFPYPSGSGLHVGHVEEKAALDIYARYRRLLGDNVLFPTGYDSFGLPTENYAIKNNLSPQDATRQNTAKFREQTENLGISYDWSRELATSDPEYYQFTQWWFLFLYERGLAYRKKQTVNWCPQDKTVLANEQVINGKCERCDSEVVQKNIEQWFFRITDYAERLLNDVDKLDWPESTKQGQRNWLGKSEGIEIDYLVPLYPKIVIGTHNAEKVDRIKRFAELNQLNIEFLTPAEAGIKELEIIEDGNSKYENALIKAKAYSQYTDLPVLSVDSGLESAEVELPFETKATALASYSKAKGRSSEYEFNKDEIAEAIIEYYSELASKQGGEFTAEFVDEYVLVEKGEVVNHLTARRPLTVYAKASKTIDKNVPLNAIYKPQVEFAGRRIYGSELTRKQRDLFIAPVFKVLQELLTLTLTVFTTRPDTNFGATFVAIAPDGFFCQQYQDLFPQQHEVKQYITKSQRKTERERQENKQKTGVFTGLYAINQLNGRPMPIYVSDFVLASVGTGALVGVPGHDARDFEFAKAMGLDIIRVVVGSDGETGQINELSQVQEAEGKLINSGFLDGVDIHQATVKIMDYLEEKGWGRRVTNYKLRDWSISRQRYWGAPIPILYRELTAEENRLNETYQAKPDLVLNLHAYESSAQRVYHPWLDKHLKSQGVSVLTPDLAGGSDPKPDEWLALATASLSNNTDNTVVTGRSLGCWTALQLAQRHKLRKLILVAPVSPISLQKDRREKSLTSKQLQMFSDFIGEGAGNVDYQQVTANVAEIVVYLSTDDPYIPFIETKHWFRNTLPTARIISQRESDHFTAERGYRQFPALLAEVLAPVRLDIIRLDEADLPVILPTDVDYRPQGTAPLGTSNQFNKSLDRKKYGEQVVREIDTMDTFVCSSWYFFRFIDPHNRKQFADLDLVNKVGPVDFYIGGAEHTVLHLLYARFFTKVAYDAGLIDFDEPFLKLRHQGLILGPDNRKMSKRWGNIIDPNDIVSKYGADTLRMYEMFMGPLEQIKPWNEGGVKGVRRFLQKVWETAEILAGRNFTVGDSAKLNTNRIRTNELLVSTAKSIETLNFNTAVSDFMKYINALQADEYALDKEAWRVFLICLHPFAPFITSELWQQLDDKAKPIYKQSWPTSLQVSKPQEQFIKLVVMVNGKVRVNLEVHKGTQEAEALELAKKQDQVSRHLAGKPINKVIFVPDKLINLVV